MIDLEKISCNLCGSPIEKEPNWQYYYCSYRSDHFYVAKFAGMINQLNISSSEDDEDCRQVNLYSSDKKHSTFIIRTGSKHNPSGIKLSVDSNSVQNFIKVKDNKIDFDYIWEKINSLLLIA